MACICQYFTIPIPPLHPRRLCIRASQIPRSATVALPAGVSTSLSETLSVIQNSCIIAGLRANDGLLAMEASHAALRGGVSVLEVMMSTPDASMVIKMLQLEYPFSIIGAGTVLNVDNAREAMSSGARFLTSPGTVMEILHEVEGSGVLYIPGVMTPTEVLCAYGAGAKLLKVYPATVLGGGKYISTLKRSFPHIPVVASQGISIDSIKHFIDAGATAVLLTDAIFDKEAMNRRDFDSILRLAGLATSKAALAGRTTELH